MGDSPQLFLRSDARAEAWALVEEFHYSHTRPRSSILDLTWHAPGGLFGDRGEVVAAAVFGYSASAWSEKVIELTRLVRRPGSKVALTGLIAAAAAELRRRGIDLLVSYADPQEGHHGGIYQAASWNYGGEKGGGVSRLRVNAIEMHPRTAVRLYGTRGIGALREMFDSVEELRRPPKHFYWRALNRRGKVKAKRLGLQSLPYPKPRPELATGVVHSRPEVTP